MDRSTTYLPVHPNENGGKVIIQINFTNQQARHNLTIEMACAKNMGEVPSHSRRLEKYIELNFPEIDSTGRANTGISIRNNIMSRVRDELDKMLHITDLETTNVPLCVPSTSTRNEYDEPLSTRNHELSLVKANLNVLRNENTALKMQLQTLTEKMEYLHKIYGTRISSPEDQIRIGVAGSMRYGENLELLNNSHLELLNVKRILGNVFKQLYDVQKTMCAATKTKCDAVNAFILSLRDELECLDLKNELDTANNVLLTLRRDADDHEREINSRYQYVKLLINMNRFEELVHTSLVTSAIDDTPYMLMDIVRKLLEVIDGARFPENNESSFELQSNSQFLLEKVYKEIFDIQKDMCKEAKSKFDSVDAFILSLRDELECLDLKNELDTANVVLVTLRRDADDHEREINSRYQHVKRLINMNRFEELIHTSLVTCVVNDTPDILMDVVRKLSEVTDGARIHQNNESSFELQLNTKLLLEKVYKEIFYIQKNMCEEAKTKFDSVDAVILTARDEVGCMDLVEELDEAANIVDALRRDTIDLETEIGLKYDHVQAMIEINAFSELLEISLVNSVISYPPDIILDLIPKLVLMCGNNDPFTGEELGRADITDTTERQNTAQNTTRNQQPEGTCPICMESFSNNTVFLECTHRYHRPCIQEWLDDNDNCPVCRQIIGNVDI